MQLATRSRKPLRSITSALTALATAVTLAACVGTDSGSNSGSEADAGGSKAPPFVTEWTTLASPQFFVEGQSYSGFSAGGRFWMFDYKDQTQLHSTTDGVNWTALSIADAGVPAEAKLITSSFCGQYPLVSEHDGTIKFIYSKAYNGSGPKGLTNEYYFVTLTGDQLSVKSGRDLGLETMPGSEDGWNFGTSCISGMLEVSGKSVLTGTGHWWKDRSTDPFTPFTAIEGSDGTWKIQVLEDYKAALDRDYFYVTEGSLEHNGTLLKSGTRSEGVMIWAGTDGLKWDELLLPLEGREVQNSWVTEGEKGFVIIAQVYDGPLATGGDESSYYTWFSPDGRDWSEATLLAEHSASPIGILTENSRGFHAVIPSAIPGEHGVRPDILFHSTDGLTWETVELDFKASSPLGNQLFAHGDGLIAFSRFSLTLKATGLDWAGS